MTREFTGLVAERRAAYTLDIHQLSVAELPAGAAIGPRENGTYPCHVLERLPKDPAELVDELKRRIEQQRVEVARHRQRYDHILKQGAAALSDYDIGIAHTDAAAAVRCALMLKHAHVSYAVSGLLKLREVLEDAEATLARDRPQLSLF